MIPQPEECISPNQKAAPSGAAFELVKKGRRPFLTKEFSLRPARFHA